MVSFIAQLTVTGLLATSTVAGLQASTLARQAAVGAVAVLAAPAMANPVHPDSLQVDEEAERLRKLNNRNFRGRPLRARQWPWGVGWGGDDDDDDEGGDDEEYEPPVPTPTPTWAPYPGYPFPGKGKGKGRGSTTTSAVVSKTSTVPVIRSTIIGTGGVPTHTPVTTLKGKAPPKSKAPPETLPGTSKHKAPTHTVTVTLRGTPTPPVAPIPTVTVTVIAPAPPAKKKGSPRPTPFYPPPFGGYGGEDDEN